MSPKIANSTISSSARKHFFELGGQAQMLQSSTLPKEQLIDTHYDVEFSGRMIGLCLYMSRILRPIWQKKLFKQHGSEFVSAVKSSTLTFVQRHLEALNEFLEM